LLPRGFTCFGQFICGFSEASTSLSNKIAVAVVNALQQSLQSLLIVAAFHAKNLIALVSSTATPPVSSVVLLSAMVAASLLSTGAGMLRLLSFVSMFTVVSAITGSCSPCLAGLIEAPDYGSVCFQNFFTEQKFGCFMRQGICGWPRSHALSGEIGERNY